MHEITIPGFEVIEIIRENSSTTTLKARQTSLDRFVDVRVLKNELAMHEDIADNFIRISRAAAKIKHANIAQIYDVIDIEGQPPYAIMEHIEGPSLADVIKAESSIAPMRAAQIVLSTAQALAQAWEQVKLVHRNIKPEEIRFDNNGTVKIVDFGRATILGDPEHTDPDKGHIIGTPNYIPPEQAQGLSIVDFRSDIYALGATFYNMVTGRIPFEGRDSMEVLDGQINRTLPHPKVLNPKLPGGLCMLIRRMMMKQMEDRASSWSVAIADIQRICNSQPPLLRKKDPKGISTIEAYQSAGGATRSKSGTAGKKPGGCGMHAFLWLTLIAWFAALGYWRWQNPDAEIPLLNKMLQGNTEERSSPLPDVTPNEAKPPLERPPEGNSTANGVTPRELIPEEQQTTQDKPSRTATAAPGEKQPRPPVPENLRNRIIDALSKEDPDAAIEILNQSRIASVLSEDAESATRILTGLKKTNDAVLQALLKHTDEPIMISFREEQLIIIPKYALGDKLHAVRVTSNKKENIVLRAEDLTPSERLRLLPPPKTVQEHAIRYMLGLSSGKNEIAATWSRKTGALSLFVSTPDF